MKIRGLSAAYRRGRAAGREAVADTLDPSTRSGRAQLVWLEMSTRAKAKALWEVYRGEFGYLAILVPAVAVFMFGSAWVQWSHGQTFLGWAYLTAAVLDALLVWTQVDLSASRVTVRDLSAQLDALDEEASTDGA